LSATLRLHTLSLRFVGYASSPHFVPTLCRLRFVSTLCPYALSKAEEQAAEVFQTRLSRLRPRPRPRPRAPVLPGLPAFVWCPARAASRDGFALPVLARFCRSCPQSGADIPVCAPGCGQTGMSAPHCHTPSLRLAGKAAPYLCWRASAEVSTALDDSRRQSTTIDDGLHRHTYVLFHDYVTPLQG